MTNHLGDMQVSKAILIMGANPAVNHPVAMQHILKAKEKNGAKIIVIDPRYTKTAAKSDIFVRIRTGTDVPFLYGMIRLAIKNGWMDKDFIRDRVYGFDNVAQECEKWTPELVSDVCGCSVEDFNQAVKAFAAAKPGCLIWNQGWTQHTIGTSNTRLGPIMQMVFGNMGKSGGGCNILRGHDNVQGASDMCNLSDSLPGYYGLAEGIWKYFAGVWGVDYDYLVGRFKSKDMMEKTGFALSNFWMGVLNDENAENNAGTPLKALVVIGNGITTVTQTHKVKEALDKLELVVFIDPYVNDAAVITDRGDNLFLLPATSQVETSGSVAATNRSYQWRSQVVKPLYEAKPDQDILFELAKRLGFYSELVKSLGKGGGDYVWPDDATKELCGAIRSIGLGGVTPERLKAQQENWHLFNPVTLAGFGKMQGAYYGLPWPCWNEKHPGTPVMYDVSKPVMQGGGMGFRENWGVDKDGVTLLAGNTPVGSSVKGGYPRITFETIEKLGVKLTDEEREKVKGKNFATDRSGILVNKALEAGLCPYGNGRARATVWNFTDIIPKHREPLHSFRQDLVAKFPTFDDKKGHFRANIRYKSEQDKQEWVKDYPVNVVTGRVVEHMGTGTETRASKYLAELSPEMFIEIHPELAGKLGVRDGDMVWVYGTGEGKIKVKAVYGYTLDVDSIFLPQNFSGVWSGKSLKDRYPDDTAPYALGENSGQVTSYGYDIQTTCPETKCTLVRIEKA
jgi:formate dehydrogenase major subunit